MAAERPQIDEADLDAIVHRLRQEVEATRSAEFGAAPEGSPSELRARRELDRIWAVTAERPYLYRPGWWGRVRGTFLLAPKTVVRRLVRWYVEPLAIDQRAFNAGVLRLADEVGERLSRLDRAVGLLEKRLERLESTGKQPPEPPR